MSNKILMSTKDQHLSNPTMQQIYQALLASELLHNLSFPSKHTHFDDLATFCKLLDFNYEYVIGSYHTEWSSRSNCELFKKCPDFINIYAKPLSQTESHFTPLMEIKLSKTCTYENFTFDTVERACATAIKKFGKKPSDFCFHLSSRASSDFFSDEIQIKRTCSFVPKFDTLLELEFLLNLQGKAVA